MRLIKLSGERRNTNQLSLTFAVLSFGTKLLIHCLWTEDYQWIFGGCEKVTGFKRLQAEMCSRFLHCNKNHLDKLNSALIVLLMFRLMKDIETTRIPQRPFYS